MARYDIAQFQNGWMLREYSGGTYNDLTIVHGDAIVFEMDFGNRNQPEWRLLYRAQADWHPQLIERAKVIMSLNPTVDEAAAAISQVLEEYSKGDD